MMAKRSCVASDCSQLKGVLKQDHPLGRMCWLGVGGLADWFYQPTDRDDLRQFVQMLDPGVRLFTIGIGSNLIVRDGGVRGIVVRLGRAFNYVRLEDNRVRAGAFTKDVHVATEAARKGLDLTFLRTVPGTLGGAVRMNAGCYGSYVADHFIEATVVLRDGSCTVLTRDDCHFGYRECNLPQEAIIVEVVLEAPTASPEALHARLNEYVDRRTASQPTGTRTAGSTFRNPAGYSSTWEDNDIHELKAWKLIDESGLRGARLGDAQVSTQHPNFLLNTGNATATQVEELGERVRREVLKQKSVVLDWEIIRLGELVPLKVKGDR